jgi:hypothetical protein
MPTREEVQAELARRARTTSISADDVAQGLTPPVLTYEPPGSGAQTERADVGAPLVPKMPPPVTDGAERKAIPGQGGWITSGGDKQGLKDAVRGTMALASGGATEAVAGAVKGADDQASREVTSADLSQMSPADLQALMQQANPVATSEGILIRTPAGWQPGQRTNAQGATGKDPNAVRAAFKLQDAADSHTVKGMEQTQAADASMYERQLAVQKNEMEATQAFKRENDAVQARYEGERQQQMERLSAIQKSMDAVPNAPRTLREKLDRSGTSDRLMFGMAAGLSVLGGAMMRDKGASVQNLLKNAQANIDRLVQKEADEYARLGQRANMAQNIYGNLRTNLKDDREAMNITKAMYYDAAISATKQIATQYKMDLQAPQIQQMLTELAKERQKLVLDTANNMQDQFSQTDKYNPGGLLRVGGGGSNAKQLVGDKDFEEGVNKFGQEVEKRGANVGERAISMYQQAINAMQEGGFARDEKFWRVFAQMNSSKNPGTQAALMASLDPKQLKAMQLIVSAGREQLLDEAGKALTGNELALDVMKKGGYSIESLDRVRAIAAEKRRQIFEATAGTYGGPTGAVAEAYLARKKLQELKNPTPGIATNKKQAIDPKDLRERVEGRLSK